MPPLQVKVGSPTTYVTILIALTIFFVVIPLLIYASRKPDWKDKNSDFAPFTWETERDRVVVHPAGHGR